MHSLNGCGQSQSVLFPELHVRISVTGDTPCGMVCFVLDSPVQYSDVLECLKHKATEMVRGLEHMT